MPYEIRNRQNRVYLKAMSVLLYTRTDYKTNTQTAKELKITPILDILLKYKRNWIQHVNRMPRNTLPGVMKRYSPTGRKESWQTF